MKKKRNHILPESGISKAFRIMKMFFIFSFVTLLNVSAGVFSENQKFDISVRNARLTEVFEQIEKKQPKFFRWHVAGDIPDAMYLAMMYRVACRFKRTKFLAFTKRYNLIRELPPEVFARERYFLGNTMRGMLGYLKTRDQGEG